jgi:hypothetical protein
VESAEVIAAPFPAQTAARSCARIRRISGECPSPTNVYNSSTQPPFENTPSFLYNSPKVPYAFPSTQAESP